MIRVVLREGDGAGIPLHVVQRGNNRQPVFFQDADRLSYLGWLREATMHHGVAVHAWCLMTNHVHLLVTPMRSRALSSALAWLGRHYVPFVNRTYGRTGTLWEGRYRASLVDSETYLRACHRYIECNPVRAGMVIEPGAYPWSSHRGNAFGHSDPLVTAHPTCEGLAPSAGARRAAYRRLFGTELEIDTVTELEGALVHNHVLGNDRFRAEIERMLGRTIGSGRPGRPRKQPAPAPGSKRNPRLGVSSRVRGAPPDEHRRGIVPRTAQYRP